MLKPSKHNRMNQMMLTVASTLLQRLQQKRAEDFVTLRKLAREHAESNDVLFVPALNFLFALGLIEYLPKQDLFQYRGP